MKVLKWRGAWRTEQQFEKAEGRLDEESVKVAESTKSWGNQK